MKKGREEVGEEEDMQINYTGTDESRGENVQNKYR